MERIKQLAAHLAPQPTGVAALQVKRPDDVVITMAVRSPLGKQKKGVFKDTQFVPHFVVSSEARGSYSHSPLMTDLTNS